MANKNKFHQGEYTPINPEKYKGTYPIYFRSSWEKKFSKWADLHSSVISWGSETIFIHYYHPIKKRIARYFPDYYLIMKDKEGIITKYIVEVKPWKETIPPERKKGKRKKTLLYESATWIVNQAKWESAKKWCKKKGLIFIIITEKQLFPHRFKK